MLKTKYVENIAEPKLKIKKKNYTTPLNFTVLH